MHGETLRQRKPRRRAGKKGPQRAGPEPQFSDVPRPTRSPRRRVPRAPLSGKIEREMQRRSRDDHEHGTPGFPSEKASRAWLHWSISLRGWLARQAVGHCHGLLTRAGQDGVAASQNDKAQYSSAPHGNTRQDVVRMSCVMSRRGRRGHGVLSMLQWLHDTSAASLSSQRPNPMHRSAQHLSCAGVRKFGRGHPDNLRREISARSDPCQQFAPEDEISK